MSKLQLHPDQELADDLHCGSTGSSGASEDLENDSFAKSILAKHRPSGLDHVHLCNIDDTDLYVWCGRNSNGYHRNFGPYMIESKI